MTNYKTILVILAAILVFISFSVSGHSLLAGFTVVILALILFFLRFEEKSISIEEIVIIGVMSAVAAVSRVPFASIPSVQPTTFVIFITAVVFGGELGFMVGAIAAFVSNIFLSQGPWTPWQMFAWGLVGYSSGILRETYIIKNVVFRYIFLVMWGFIFGWITNVWMVLQFGNADFIKAFIAAGVSSFYFDLSHGIGNVVFSMLFYNQFYRILERVYVKYKKGCRNR